MAAQDPLLGAIQAEPIYFNRDASCEKACRLIEQAGEAGCTLAAFGETWLPGYPFHAVKPKFGSDLWWEVAARYLDQAVDIPSATTDALCKAAKKGGLDIVIGVAERDDRTRGTVYCTQLFIGREGEIIGKHRKLKPTMHERMAWGEGDGSDLIVFDRPYGRLSGLNCWEHQMVLPGYALIAQGTQFHVGCWPGDEPPARSAVAPVPLGAAASSVASIRRPGGVLCNLRGGPANPGRCRGALSLTRLVRPLRGQRHYRSTRRDHCRSRCSERGNYRRQGLIGTSTRGEGRHGHGGPLLASGCLRFDRERRVSLSLKTAGSWTPRSLLRSRPGAHGRVDNLT